MPYPTDVTDAQWRLLEPVLGRGGRGPSPVVDRRTVVNAVLYQAKTGCQWRMLPAEFGNWNTIWRTWARWRDRGVWQRVLDLLRRRLRVAAGRDPEPSLLMVDCQVVKGGRCGASFHEGHFKYRLNGAKRAIAIDYLGLPVTVGVTGARTHDVRAARELLAGVLPAAGRVRTVMGDRGFRGLAGPLAREHGVETVIKHDPDRPKGEFRPLQPLWKAKALVTAHAVLVVEDLNLKNMTRSAKGTVEEPGRNVAAKAGLNRSLAEAAPGEACHVGARQG